MDGLAEIAADMRRIADYMTVDELDALLAQVWARLDAAPICSPSSRFRFSWGNEHRANQF
jgi:hypothetical protein